MVSPPAFAEEKRKAADRTHGELVGGDEGARNGVEYDAELLKYTEGNGNDGFVG